jgi:uncharacterized protein involved in outer membrane biogenesis
MRKLIKWIGCVILLCIIGGAILAFLLWSRLPDIVASSVSKRLQTSVEIGDIYFSQNSIDVDRFVIHNPKGFKLPRALSAEKIDIEAPLTHYLKNNIEIDEIVVQDVYIGLEFDSIKSTQGNWSTLLTHAKHAQEESSKSASNKTVFIKRLALLNIHVELLYQNDGKVRKLKPIKQIELKNISSTGGNVGDQLMNSALGEAIKQVFIEENLKDVLDQLMQVPGNPLKEYIGPLKSFFGSADIEEPLPL